MRTQRTHTTKHTRTYAYTPTLTDTLSHTHTQTPQFLARPYGTSENELIQQTVTIE